MNCFMTVIVIKYFQEFINKLFGKQPLLLYTVWKIFTILLSLISRCLCRELNCSDI